jgi:hypothetical protein
MRSIFQNADLFLKTLSEQLKKQDMSLILVIPVFLQFLLIQKAPRDDNPLFQLSDLKHFSNYVTKFSLMSYDSSQSAIGPNSPMEVTIFCIYMLSGFKNVFLILNFQTNF